MKNKIKWWLLQHKANKMLRQERIDEFNEIIDKLRRMRRGKE